MIQKLQTHGFTWKERIHDFTPEKIDQLVKEDEKGYILEINVEHPKELHKKHNEQPFFCS